MRLRPELRMSVRLHDVPEGFAHFCAPWAIRGGGRINFGVSICSALNSEAAASVNSDVRCRSVIRTASQWFAIAAKDGTTGTPIKCERLDLSSTTPATSTPVSSAQIIAISARSDIPPSASREKPRSAATPNNALHSALAWRKKLKETDKYSSVSRDFSAKPTGVR